MLDKRAKRKRESGKTEDGPEDGESTVPPKKSKVQNDLSNVDFHKAERRRRKEQENGDVDPEKTKHLQTVLSSIF